MLGCGVTRPLPQCSGSGWWCRPRLRLVVVLIIVVQEWDDDEGPPAVFGDHEGPPPGVGFWVEELPAPSVTAFSVTRSDVVG